MQDMAPSSVLERKVRLAAGRRLRPGSVEIWRRTVPRLAEEALALEVAVLDVAEGVEPLSSALGSLSEADMMIGLGREEGSLTGAVIAEPAVVAAVIECQTTGQVSSFPVGRCPGTATDLALLSHVLDGWLAAAGQGATPDGAGPLACVRSLPDVRAVQLALDEREYRVTRLDLEFAGGRRRGRLRILRPESSATRTGPDRHALRAALHPLPARIEAVLCRVRLPLERVIALQAGDLVDLDSVSVRQITLEAPIGKVISRAHLGQAGGMRAVRILGAVPEIDAPDPASSEDTLPPPADKGDAETTTALPDVLAEMATEGQADEAAIRSISPRNGSRL